MPITPTLTIDHNVMTQHWQAGLQSPQNAAKLIYKYDHPHRVFNFNPPQQEADFAAGVQRAVSAHKYASGIAGADLNAASKNMTDHGGSNWSQSGTTKLYKFARKAASLAAAENNVLAQVERMPKGRGANNRARMLAWHDLMSAYYGKITSA